MKKTTKNNARKHKNVFVQRQHDIGKIFRNLTKQGFDNKTAIKVALECTSDYRK